jgi:hypothetical protein
MPSIIPQEALAYLKNKNLKAGFSYKDVWNEEHATAFTVAKAMQLDVLSDLHTAVVDAMEKGQSFESFKKNIRPLLQQKGWWGRKDMEDPQTGHTVNAQLGSDRRLKTIYRVNMRSAYQKGQYDRTMASDLHPYLMYRIGPSVQHREDHKSWDGLILPKDDPWWDSHFPPNGWGCKCYTRAVTEARKKQYEENGIPTAPRLDGTGGGNVLAKTQAPPVKYKTYFNERKGTVEQAPEGVNPAFNWNQGKAGNKTVLQKLEASQQNYEKAAAVKPKKEYITAKKQEGNTADLDAQIKNATGKKAEKAINKEMAKIQKLGKATGCEHLGIVRDDGASLGTWKGKKDSVNITSQMRKILISDADNSLVIIHNHPNNTSFSLADLDVMCKYNSIKELKIVGHNGQTFSMAVGKGQRVTLNELEKFEKTIYNTIRTNVGNKATTGIRTNYYSERNRLMAEHFGWAYKEG